MIDFVKLYIKNPDIRRIKDHPALEWFQKTSERTGEVKEYSASFNGLNFLIKCNDYFQISGSVHKYFNSINGNGFQNYNDFTFADLSLTIKDICQRFILNPQSCYLQNVEFGVNVSPGIPANEILKSVINHKGNPFTRLLNSNRKRFRECEYSQNIIKIYDKGLQYEQPANILRFEVKVVAREYLKRKGVLIDTLADLLDRDKILRLGVILRGEFDELLIYDNTIQDEDLTPSQHIKLTRGQDPGYWVKEKERQPENFSHTRDRFRELVKRFGKQNTHETIGELIIQKWNDLLNAEPEKYEF